jgi:hypothetical protein
MKFKISLTVSVAIFSALCLVHCRKQSALPTLEQIPDKEALGADDRAAVCFISVRADCPVNVCGSQTNDIFCSGLKGTETGVTQAIYSLSLPAKVQFSNLPFGQNCVVRVNNALSGRVYTLNLSSGQSRTIKVLDNCGIEVLD